MCSEGKRRLLRVSETQGFKFSRIKLLEIQGKSILARVSAREVPVSEGSSYQESSVYKKRINVNDKFSKLTYVISIAQHNKQIMI